MSVTKHGLPKRPDDGRLLLAVALVASAVAVLGPLASYDLWWHLRAGELIVSELALPHADPFSHTANGAPWTYHSWLGGVTLSLLYAAGGGSLLVLWRSLMLVAALLLVWRVATRRGVSPGLACVLLLTACLQLRVRALARPHLYSLLLFAVFLNLLDRDLGREADGRVCDWLWGRRGRLLLLPPLMVLWANLHGGFPVGILLIGAYGAGELVSALASSRDSALRAVLGGQSARLHALALVGVLCLPAALLNPYGFEVLRYPVRLMQLELIRQVEEWQPVPLRGDYAVFWAALAIGALALVRAARNAIRGGAGASRARGTTDALLLLGFGAMAIRGLRHVAWVMLILPPVIGPALEIRSGGADNSRRGRLYTLAVAILAFAVAASPFVRSPRRVGGVSRERLPVDACEFIAAHGLMERPWNSYAWGGYLIWRFWPRMHVFIDGRCLVYGDEGIRQYLTVKRGGEGWREILKRRDVRMLVYRHADTGRHLLEGGEWTCVYWDDVATVALPTAVAGARDLTDLTATHPHMFQAAVRERPPEELLAALDVVLQRVPDCWTALSYRARCLVRLAVQESARSESLLREAGESVERALELNDGSSVVWRARAEVARAQGDDALAANARSHVARLVAESE